MRMLLISIWIHFKLMFHNKITMSAFVVSTLLFLVISSALADNAQIKAGFPIGIANEDQNESSNELVNHVKETEGIYVYEGTTEQMKDLLLDELIVAYVVIKDGYEEKMKQGDTKEVLEFHYLEGNENITIITDFIAESIVYHAALYKSTQMYEELKGTTYSRQQYMDYVKQLYNSKEYEFVMDMKFVTVGTAEETHPILTNGLVYYEVIAGLIAIFLSFIAAFFVYGAKSTTIIEQREQISLLSGVTYWFGKFIAVFFVMEAIGVMLTFYSIATFGLTLPSFLSLYVVLTLLNGGMILLFLVISHFSKSAVSYQMMTSLVILLFGGISLLGICSPILPEQFMKVSEIIPNYWFINQLTDIIVKG